LAWYWCQTLGSDYENNEIYRKNFQEYFTKSLKLRFPHATDLNKFDFTEVKLVMEREKEERKNKSEAEKGKQKAARDELNRYYGYAIVDGTFKIMKGLLKK
jgi:DNA topoisomerase-1